MTTELHSDTRQSIWLVPSACPAHSQDFVFEQLLSQLTCGGPLIAMLCEGCRRAFQPMSHLLSLASTLMSRRIEPMQPQVEARRYVVYQLIIHPISLVPCECIVGLMQEEYMLEKAVLQH